MAKKPLYAAWQGVVHRGAAAEGDLLECLPGVAVSAVVRPRRVEPSKSGERGGLQPEGQSREHLVDAERAPAECLRFTRSAAGQRAEIEGRRAKELICPDEVNWMEADRLNGGGQVVGPSRIAPARQRRRGGDCRIELGEEALLLGWTNGRGGEGARDLVAEATESELPLLVMHRLRPAHA